MTIGTGFVEIPGIKCGHKDLGPMGQIQNLEGVGMDLGEGQKEMGSGAQPNVWDQNVISKEGVKGGKMETWDHRDCFST